MARNIRDVFAEQCGHLKIDSRFARRVIDIERSFVNSDQDRMVFLGGALLGTPPFRFHSSDRNDWFDLVLEVDDKILETDLHSLPTVVPDHNVASDVFNLSIAWTVHAIITSTNLSGRQKEEAALAALKFMHYRFLGSLMAHRFRYEPDRAVVEATYAALSRKFALKQTGSWAAMLDQRCRAILQSDSIHVQALNRFSDDDAIAYFITDTQSRIRAAVNKMVEVFYQVQRSGARVTTQSSTMDLDGITHVRDLERNSTRYRRYADQILQDRRTYIRPELMKIIVDMMPTTLPPRHLQSVLEYMVDNAGRRGDRNIDELVKETLLHALGFINDNRSEFSGNLDLAKLLSRLKALYMSSRSSDPSLLKMRDLSLKISKRAVKSNNNSLLSAIRTGNILYMVLRVFTMNYYLSGGSMESRQPKEVTIPSEDDWLPDNLDIELRDLVI